MINPVLTAVPSNVDAERTILGSILLDNRVFDQAEQLRQTDWFLDSHRVIFRTMVKMILAGVQADTTTVPEYLQRDGQLSSIGGVAYIWSLTENLPRRIAIADYVQIVKEKAQLRMIMGIANEVTLRAADESEPAVAILQSAREALDEILSDSSAIENTHVGRYTAEVLEKWISDRRSVDPSTLSYGIPTLDEHTGGMYAGENTTIGGDPGHGKSSLAIQAILANCPRNHSVFFVSLEMTRAQVLKRLWANESGVENYKLRRPKLANEFDANCVMEAAGRVSTWPLHIYDRSSVRLVDLTAMLRVAIRKHKIRLFIVDFAQIVAAQGKDFREQVSRASTELTAIAKGEGVHLMLLSQMSRKSHAEWNRPPRMSDLRESGALEQNAHCIVLIHRPWDDDNGRVHTRPAAYEQVGCELIVAKQREGATCAFPVTFNNKTLRFEG